MAHGLNCSVACGIFPDQGSNPCPLHWQADSQPLHHQGRPTTCIFIREVLCQFRSLSCNVIWEGDLEMELEMEEVYCEIWSVEIEGNEEGLDYSR